MSRTERDLLQPEDGGFATSTRDGQSVALLVRSAFETARPMLELVEQRVISCLTSDARVLTEIASYLLQQGGKRIRPLLTILSGRLFGMRMPSSSLIDVAAGIELIHMATLLHDDIIDQSPLRRSQPSAYKLYGLTKSLLAGDFLLVRAFGLCSHLDSFIVDATEKACVELTEGETLEGTLNPADHRSLDDYFVIVRKKTASLFALSCLVGAHLAEADQTHVIRLRSFGKNAGMAFQIVDDILDIVADEGLLGKPAGTDLRQKTPSIINLLWLRSEDPAAREFFGKEQITEQDCREAINRLKQSSIINEAIRLARGFCERAHEELRLIDGPFVDETSRLQLEALLSYTLNRCK